MGGNEFKYVQEVFKDNWIAPVGPQLGLFEKSIQDYVGVNHSVALSSGTSAIHLALIILGVTKGDEVLCSSFTFSASANPIVYQGATPIFVDSEKETWNMCPNLLQEAILDRIKKGKKPKACILVHLYGSPANINEICEVLDKYDIPLIEDAAEALGSKYKGKKVGSFGKLSIFSFNGNKIITTSGGGALVSNQVNLIEKARFLSTQAKDPADHYEHSEIGYNYRLSNVCAGIGLGQMEVLNERVNQKRSINDFYKSILGNVPGVQFLEEADDNFNNHWLSCILLTEESAINRFNLMKRFAEANIESRPLWKPMHMQPIFQDAPAYTNGVSEELFETGLCLPSDTNMDEADLNRVALVLKNCFSL